MDAQACRARVLAFSKLASLHRHSIRTAYANRQDDSNHTFAVVIEYRRYWVIVVCQDKKETTEKNKVFGIKMQPPSIADFGKCVGNPSILLGKK